MIRRGLGWRKDRPGHDEPARRMLAARRARASQPPLVTPSMRRFGGPIMNQGVAGACFAFAVCAMLERYYAARGHVGVPRASPLPIYYQGRAIEFAEDGPELARTKIDDFGTYPRLGVLALQATGFVPWAQCPYPTDEATLYDESRMRRIVNTQPPPRVFERAYSQRGLEYSRPERSGVARVAAVMDALYHRTPVGFGVEVDEAFLDNTGRIVETLRDDQLVGGHMLCLDEVGFDPRLPAAVTARLDNDARAARDAGELERFCEQHLDALIVSGPNSWGKEWGASGRYTLRAQLFACSFVDDVTLIDFAPLTEAA